MWVEILQRLGYKHWKKIFAIEEINGFLIEPKNKVEIKNAVEQLYSVKVESVNTMNYAGKRKSRFTKSGVISGKTSAYKKAIITLKAGEVIDFFSNI